MPNKKQQIPLQQTLFDLSSLPTFWEESYKGFRAKISESKRITDYCYSIEIYSPKGDYLQMSEVIGNSKQSVIFEFRSIVNQYPAIKDSDLRRFSVPEQNRLVLERFCEGGVPEQNISETTDIQLPTKESSLILLSSLHDVPSVSEQDVLEHSLIDTTKVCKVDSIVLEQVTNQPIAATAYSVPEHHCHWLEVYVPSKRKSHKYYRYCWKVGRKIKHIHIPGGNVKNEVALVRSKEIRDAIRDGEAPDLIIQTIRRWPR